MAARNHRTTRDRALLRVGGLLAAVLAAAGLVLLPPSAGGGRAQADTGSAATKSGTRGPYDDFSALKVTVEQTRDLRTQGVKVSWSGGAPTRAGSAGVYGTDFLQIMQCWGDAKDGPRRDQCEFGNPPVGVGSLATGRTVGYGPGPLADPLEPSTDPNGVPLPFTPAKGTASSDLNQFFTRFTTNEQDVTSTGTDGRGETIFQLEASTESQILGCGTVPAAGRPPQPCWLVVVPRGSHEPNGSMPADLHTSPLSASNWAQRIQFRMDFKPTDAFCPIGQKEQPTIGSQLAAQAMSSWEPTLCTSDKITYGFVPQPEDFARQQIANPGTGSAGLAFVEDPVAAPSGAPPVVHAPVAVSGLVIGYNIEISGSSKQVPRIRLNARLVAKMLSESYQCDLPADNTALVRGGLPKENARSVYEDPEFVALNQGAGYFDNSSCTFGLGVPQGASDSAAQLWRWLRSDPDAKAFLAGKPDPWGMRINPSFRPLTPDVTPLSEFPKPDPTVWVPNKSFPDIKITAVGLNPYGQDLNDDARRVRKANNTGVAGFSLGSVPPAPAKAETQIPGQYFNMGVTDTTTAALYRLGTAELLNADGQFVAPTTDSLTKAVAGMKAGQVPGVLDADPAAKTPGAYPLTSVTYAAAATSLDVAQRQDYATLIRYAAGPGQTTGIGNGLLPPGYAPLPQTLRDQALTAASDLVAGRVPTTPPADGATTGGGTAGGSVAGGAGPGGSAGGTDSGGTATGGNGTATGGGSPSPSAAATGATKGSAGGPSPSPSALGNVAQTGGTTPGALLGAVRWVLLSVLIAGVAGSLAGPLLMRWGMRRPAPAPQEDLRAP